MRWVCSVVLAVFLSLSSIQGAVVSGTNIGLTPQGDFGLFDADYALTVLEDEPGNDFTSIFFDVVGTTLQFVDTNIDGGSDWYLTQSGDLFTAENILGGEFEHFFIIDGFQSNDIDVGTAPFFLGVNADDYTHFNHPRGTFGWAQLQIVNGRLTMLDNAVSYGEGIIVGTTTPIPEPAAMTLVGFALVFTLRRRRTN